jgi:hypothetical protein
MLLGKDVNNGSNRGEQSNPYPSGSAAEGKGALSIKEQVAEVMRINQSAKLAVQDGQFQKVNILTTFNGTQMGKSLCLNLHKLGGADELVEDAHVRVGHTTCHLGSMCFKLNPEL